MVPEEILPLWAQRQVGWHFHCPVSGPPDLARRALSIDSQSRTQSGSRRKWFVHSSASDTCQIRRISSMACAIGMDLGIRIKPGQLWPATNSPK